MIFCIIFCFLEKCSALSLKIYTPLIQFHPIFYHVSFINFLVSGTTNITSFRIASDSAKKNWCWYLKPSPALFNTFVNYFISFPGLCVEGVANFFSRATEFSFTTFLIPGTISIRGATLYSYNVVLYPENTTPTKSKAVLGSHLVRQVEYLWLSDLHRPPNRVVRDLFLCTHFTNCRRILSNVLNGRRAVKRTYCRCAEELLSTFVLLSLRTISIRSRRTQC